MKISPINSYNYTSFAARKGGKYAGQHTNNQSNTTKTIATVGGIGLAGATLVGASLLLPSCSNGETGVVETTPSTSYVETVETKSYDDIIAETIDTTSNNVVTTPKISAIPQSEREAVWYEVKKGDRLADIVKEYAELHELTPDEELVPYYELLEADNPGKWEDRNNIWIGIRFRVDSIMPENRITTEVPTSPVVVPDETQGVETQPTEEQQVSSENDKVQINGNTFTFDIGTMDKTFLGDYEGLMYGKFATVDKKVGGGVVLKMYEGVTSKTNISEEVTYDKDGKITEIVDYKNNKPVQVSSYAYKMDSMIVTETDKTAKSNQIDQVVTEYANSDDSIISRQFMVNGKTVANFDFKSNTVQIGEEVWNLDSFDCNDDAIGSKKYVGTFNGGSIRFDVLKNGYIVEYPDTNGEIYAREQYDSDGELIFEEIK